MRGKTERKGRRNKKKRREKEIIER